jgi:glycosyltransferase involved in cell wall biosynthesis
VRIGVNGWRLLGPQTGVARYIHNIVRHWTADVLPGGLEIVVHAPAPLSVELPDTIRVRVHRSRARMIVWDNTRLGPRVDDDVLWCPSHSRPLLSRSPTVVTLHDSVWLKHPDQYSRHQRAFYNRLYVWSGQRSRLTIVDTEAARDDIVHHTRIAPERIRVVEMAAAEHFRPVSGDSRERLTGSPAPFFLFVGKMSGRRNVKAMFEAFAQFVRSSSLPHRLVLVGFVKHREALSELFSALGILERTTICGFVSDEDLNLLYNGADALVMPSDYETVSLPVMEAQAAGTPVICIDTPGMRDMTGGVGRLIPRMESGLLAEAMIELGGDQALRARFSEQGLANARRFSWEKTSARTLEVLLEAARA